ncbi:hypothetical protein B0H16DRAFT_1477177 [Mycena metata]|uniref:Uncharacterized protein n=1 Tax=Mycena metata TaxID=1033252 RepID=A0AAD7MG19_9AGAR|nr:hypothetical protein B0H16DRAFT_1477177 [Mycena metata]
MLGPRSRPAASQKRENSAQNGERVRGRKTEGDGHRHIATVKGIRMKRVEWGWKGVTRCRMGYEGCGWTRTEAGYKRYQAERATAPHLSRCPFREKGGQPPRNVSRNDRANPFGSPQGSAISPSRPEVGADAATLRHRGEQLQARDKFPNAYKKLEIACRGAPLPAALLVHRRRTPCACRLHRLAHVTSRRRAGFSSPAAKKAPKKKRPKFALAPKKAQRTPSGSEGAGHAGPIEPCSPDRSAVGVAWRMRYRCGASTTPPPRHPRPAADTARTVTPYTSVDTSRTCPATLHFTAVPGGGGRRGRMRHRRGASTTPPPAPRG